MNPSMVGTYDPANGLRMTVREAARRKGVAAMAPPSWKISSTHVIFLRTTSSGMHQAPFTNERRTQFRDGTNHTRFSLQFQSGTPDQANFLQAFGGLRTNQQRLINLCCAQLSDGLSDRAIRQFLRKTSLGEQGARRCPRHYSHRRAKAGPGHASRQEFLRRRHPPRPPWA